jgi:hypothetical protein
MDKQSTNVKPLKKLSLADLQKVVGGRPRIKITVENSSGTDKASGES